MVEIRTYVLQDEPGWLRCRVLSFLDTAYYDDVCQEKETYTNPSVELIAVDSDSIVGLLDIEFDTDDRAVCSQRPGQSGMIWHLAVHPDHQRNEIASMLLDSVRTYARQHDITRFEAWTRDDADTIAWYESHGFTRIDAYLHVYLSHEEAKATLESTIPGMTIQHVFANYTADTDHHIQEQFERVHECQCYELQF